MFNEAGVNGARRELAADNLIENAAETVFRRVFLFVGEAAHNLFALGLFWSCNLGDSFYGSFQSSR